MVKQKTIVATKLCFITLILLCGFLSAAAQDRIKIELNMGQERPRIAVPDFKAANDLAIAQLKQYSAYLREQKLPKADNDFALGPEKYARLLEYGELVKMSPEQLLDIGFRELHAQQTAFAKAAQQLCDAFLRGRIIATDEHSVLAIGKLQRIDHHAESLSIFEFERNQSTSQREDK